MKSLETIIKIADTHADRILRAMEFIQNKMPVTDNFGKPLLATLEKMKKFIAKS